MPTLVKEFDKRARAVPPIHTGAEGDESALIAAAKNGNARAFEALIARYQRRILSVALRRARVRQDAEDIVQQSFQKAFVHLQEFEGRSSFSTWLTRIAINEALMCLRTNRGASAVSIDELITGEGAAFALEVPDLGPSPERSYSQQERKRILSLAINQLTPGIRTAIQLRELDERSLKESAQMMGVSIAAAKSRVLRGRRKLRETLKRYVSPTWMTGSKRLQISADTNRHSRSPAARG